MKKLIIISLFSIGLLGCASDYKLYSASMTSINIAKSNAESEKYKAISAIGASGSETAKIAAVMALALGNSGQQSNVQMAAPENPMDTTIRALGIFVPAIVQGYGLKVNSQLGMKQSDNSMEVSKSTNSSFVGIAGKIQSSNSTVTTTSNTDTHAITGSYNPTSTSTNNSNQGNPTSTNNSNQGNPTSTNNSNQGNPIDNSNQGNPIDNSLVPK